MKLAVLKIEDRVVIEHTEVVCGMLERMRGLLGRNSLDAGCGMLLLPCNSIHTFFMRFTLDVFFLNKAMKVVKTQKSVKPWRMVSGGFNAHATLETQAGWLSDTDIKEGDIVSLL